MRAIYVCLVVVFFALKAQAQTPCIGQDSAPVYGTGKADFAKYIGANLVFQKDSNGRTIEGRVVVGFTIDSTGKVVNVHVIKSADPLLDSETTRVMKAMPKWKPACRDGLPVAANQSMPITFQACGPK